jgi:hypothetical protein
MTLSFILLLFSVFLNIITSYSQVIPVDIVSDGNGNFQLLREGEPYIIKGGGSTNVKLLPELKARGGNSIRTWGIDGSTLYLLNEAHKHGISVMLGLWLKKEQDGFNYNDSARVSQQLESFRPLIRQFRNHPALLAWSIGNELDAGYTNLKVWNAVNDMSKMIHEEDGNHPTLTIIICSSTSKLNAIAERAPDLDMLGINSYACISSVHNNIAASNWEKPYVLTEWGVNGPWEVAKTSWSAPLEPSSTQKAELFSRRYSSYIEPFLHKMPGSYAFYWNSKYEATYTWFGLFVGQESTEIVDVLQNRWTGLWPENIAPSVQSVKINGLEQNRNVRITRMSGNEVVVTASDPEDDLSYEYLVIPESKDMPVETIEGATYKALAGIVDSQNGSTAFLNFKASHNHMNLRLYVLIRDGQGHIATATFPFQTDFSTLGLSDTHREKKKKFIVSSDPSGGDFFRIQNLSGDACEIYLYNSCGKLILINQFDSNEFLLDKGHLNPGVFFLVFRLDDGSREYQKILN